MIRVDETELKVGVTLEVLWKALSKDLLKFIFAATIPEFIKEVKILEGDGSLDTVYLLEFNPDVPNLSPQKEKIAEFDESLHKIALQAIEGGRMNLGYTFYKTTFQLTTIDGNSDMTLVNIKVAYEIESQEILPPGEAVKLAVGFIKSLETLLKKHD